MQKTRAQDAPIEVDIFDVSLVKKLFPPTGRESISSARKLLASGNIGGKDGVRFLLTGEKNGSPADLKDASLLIYFLKREFGDVFILSSPVVTRILSALGQDEGERLIASLTLPLGPLGRVSSPLQGEDRQAAKLVARDLSRDLSHEQ